MNPMQVLSVQMQANLPFVLLRDIRTPERARPVFIGPVEASSIALALAGIESERPKTHDLIVSILESLGQRLDAAVVSELREGTFFAELRFSGSAGPFTVSSRPSDAIAIALRVGAPVYATDAVLDEAGVVVTTRDELIDEAVETFRHELDTLDPADFVGPLDVPDVPDVPDAPEGDAQEEST